MTDLIGEPAMRYVALRPTCRVDLRMPSGIAGSPAGQVSILRQALIEMDMEREDLPDE